MRTVAEVSHPLMRISITSWNGKYAIRYELDRYEQVFKVPETDVSGLGAMTAMAEALAEEALLGFVAMRDRFTPHLRKAMGGEHN